MDREMKWFWSDYAFFNFFIFKYFQSLWNLLPVKFSCIEFPCKSEVSCDSWRAGRSSWPDRISSFAPPRAIKGVLMKSELQKELPSLICFIWLKPRKHFYETVWRKAANRPYSFNFSRNGLLIVERVWNPWLFRGKKKVLGCLTDT